MLGLGRMEVPARIAIFSSLSTRNGLFLPPFLPSPFNKQALLKLIEAWKEKLSSRDNSPANHVSAATGVSNNGAVTAGVATRGGGAVTIDEAFAPDHVIPEVKVRHLKAPFLKFDDVSGLHRPCFAEFNEWPTVYLHDRPSTFSPFVKNGIGGRGDDKSEADVDDDAGKDRRKKEKKARKMAEGDNNNNSNSAKKDKTQGKGKDVVAGGTGPKKGKKDIKERAKEVSCRVFV